MENLNRIIRAGKVIVVYGPRRCGKTTLIKKMIEDLKEDHIFADGEDIGVQDYLSSQSTEKLKRFMGGKKVLVIDEAQKIKNIALNLKLMVDNIEGIKIIATGSSSFDLAREMGEPLVGRKYTLKMYPIAQIELVKIERADQIDSSLESRLIYGSYPEIVLMEDDTARSLYLKELISSALYRDILEIDGVRHSDKLVRILQLLAFQIGKEVSCSEIGLQVGMSKNTVDRYLDLLEKCFVIFRLRGFSRNLRKEISKNPRYYFYDNGVRNALVSNFNPLALRDDIGMLWENYVIIERIKKQEYTGILSNNYFWRTYDRKEIDLIEEREGKLFGYEIKWSARKQKKPIEWTGEYKNSEYLVINRENYLDFIA
ncbi:MAG: ATP-binding protein [Candidatus Omnitrophota bacterium]